MITLAVLCALKARGISVRAAKSGPDYIDPQFLTAATGLPCLTLDSWAMGPDRIRAVAQVPEDFLVIEGAMGLFDGALDTTDPLGRGSTADVALALGAPVILVVDVARQAQTAAAVAKGLSVFRRGVEIVGVILNRVASPRHRRSVEHALEASGMPVFGTIPRRSEFEVPSRHLGLVQAGERDDLDAFVARAGCLVAEFVDLDGLLAAAAPIRSANRDRTAVPPLGQRIAVARDEAFAFSYEHLFAAWRRAGAELFFFSPLANESPTVSVDAIYLPGGYPELHAGRIAACNRFQDGVREAARRGTAVYGECGGYMVLGRGLVDDAGHRHAMLGLLPVETSFTKPLLHIGYRYLQPYSNPIWPEMAITGHEFHFARETSRESEALPLFAAWDSEGTSLGDMGVRAGRVMGSFAHVIDRK